MGLDSVVCSMLPNGLTVLIRPDHSAPVVAIVTVVKAGYFDETDDVIGIAHVLEHMFFKGTESRGVGEIAKQTKAAGGYLNAHTIYDNTTYYTVLPSASFGSGLEIQADAYARSLIDAGELSRELEVIIQEAKRKADNPPALATETLYELLHDRHRMRRWRIGHEEGLRRIDRPAMLHFYRNFYRPSNTIMSIVGDVDADEALTRVTRLYGALDSGAPDREPGPEEPHHEDFRYRELSGDIGQSHILVGWRTAPALHEDTPVLDVAAGLLGSGRASRLYRSLRERKLASSVTAYNYTPTEVGVFVTHAETSAEKLADAAGAIWEEVRALREDAIDPAELERVRRIFESRWIRRLETMEGQAAYLAEWEALGGWQLGDEYLSRVESVTAEDVHRVARHYLAPERAGVVAYRPASAARLAANEREMLAILDVKRPAPIEPLPPRDPVPVPAPALHAELDRVEGKVSVFRGAEGLPILVRPKPGAAIAYLGVFGKGGAVTETAETSGITSLVARTMLKGTVRRSARLIAEDVELLGGRLSASVGTETFGWTISVPGEHLEAASELLADVIRNATLPNDAFEAERAAALAEVAALRDDMYGYPLRLAARAAFGDHPYARPALGSESSLTALSVERARDWYVNVVSKVPLVVGVVGDVLADDAAGILARDLMGIGVGVGREPAAPQWPPRLSVLAESREKAQTALALGFPGPARRDPRRYAAHMIGTIASGLGGRFFDELRDRQSLAYTVHAHAVEHAAAGMFMAYIATSPEKEERAREGMLHEIERLAKERVGEDELERGKRYTVGTHAIRQESGASLLGSMVEAWLLGEGLEELEMHDERVEAITATEIIDVAREFFDPSRRVEGIVRGIGKSV
jgi:zinc protease